MNMKIEKNIPIPKSGTYRGKYKDVLLEMEVGDSVVTNFKELTGMRQAAKVLGYKITARKLDERYETESDYRVWRIE